MWSKNLRRARSAFLICTAFFIGMLALAGRPAFAQVDEGTITGMVADASNALIPGAEVTLTNTDTGFVLKTKSNALGVYIFTPIKIGNYRISASAAGFKTMTRENLHLDLQQRLNVVLTLSPGIVTETITVTDEIPLLQTQEGTVGQVLDAESISDTPLNGRNWVYIAQLTAGVAPPFGGTRGSGAGDFVANGQSAEQNNFILDGVDNNTSLVDFLNGSSYVMRPPPDALAEFKIDTSTYSAEFGHSAGAVVNASIKSGTNDLHGNLWEYVRNNDLDATNWNAAPGSTLPYHENQFGASAGFPILKNKLFYFGDFEANRISIDNVNILSVPTDRMRTGDFSELLTPGLNGKSYPVYLYQPNSGGNSDPSGQSTTNRLSCNGQPNVLCNGQIANGQIDPLALKILGMYPEPRGPNATTQIWNNLNQSVSQHNNTAQWDQRLDWNPTVTDQTYARYSYNHVQGVSQLPLGPVLDGSGYGGYQTSSLAENFMFSETHIFSSTLTNAFRIGYNWGQFLFLQANAKVNESATLGLGGVPFGPQYPLNGGLPNVAVYGLSGWGSPGTSDESQNVSQIMDNVIKNYRSHSITAGFSMQDLRYFYRYAANPRGYYGYTGTYTGSPAASIATGFGVADFLLNQMNYAGISNAPYVNDQQWYTAAFIQDDWKFSPKLTLNLGIRYDYYQPYKENSGSQANFVVNGPLGIGTGSAVFQIVDRGAQNIPLGSAFTNVLAQNNVSIQYVSKQRLVSAQHLNLSPRVGFAYQWDAKTVLNGGFGVFFGGLQAEGNGNLGANFPYTAGGALSTPNCSYNNCPSLDVTLENGLGSYIAQGLQQFVSYPGFHAIQPSIDTPYTMDYNLAVQRAVTKDIVATVSYVANVSRHLPSYWDPNGYSPVLLAPGQNTQSYQSFPTLGGVGTINYNGVSTYNSLQGKLERRFANGLSFLGTYTWAHALTDASDAGGLQSAIGNRNERIIPMIEEYTNSAYDVRHRFTLNSHYDLPFGKGKAYLNSSRWLDQAVGGWAASLTFAGQTGTPFTVSPNISTAAGGSARANLVRNPFAGGGSPDPTNPSIACPAHVRNRDHWFNPCAFANPLPGNLIATPVSDVATAKLYLGGRSNQVYGPGYSAVNMSAFKSFRTFREQSLEFRVDSFNLLNHPTLGNPSGSIDNNGGEITGPKFFQNDTPDARFFQLSLKYTY